MSSPPASINKRVTPLIRKGVMIESKVKNYEAIGSGPLSIKDDITSFSLPDVTHQVDIFSHTQGDSTYYHLSIHQGLMKKRVTKGEKLFLAYQDELLILSNKPTPLWLKLMDSKKGEATLQLGLDLFSGEGDLVQTQTRIFHLHEKIHPFRKDELTDPALIESLSLLEKARWWAPDLLFSSYGGEEYGVHKGKQRLLMEGQELLYVEKGSYFHYHGKKWEKGKRAGCPTAWVRKVSPHKMEWDLCDQSGFEWTRVSLEKERNHALSLRMEEIFSKVHQRTKTRASCHLENRPITLKKGDWLLRTEKGWHTIKNRDEVDAILSFKVSGELFIFDGIERKEGKEFFTGTLFDSMRVDQRKVAFPIPRGRTHEGSSSPKRVRSTKIEPLAIKEMHEPLHEEEQMEEREIFDE